MHGQVQKPSLTPKSLLSPPREVEKYAAPKHVAEYRKRVASLALGPQKISATLRIVDDLVGSKELLKHMTPQQCVTQLIALHSRVGKEIKDKLDAARLKTVGRYSCYDKSRAKGKLLALYGFLHDNKSALSPVNKPHRPATGRGDIPQDYLDRTKNLGFSAAEKQQLNGVLGELIQAKQQDVGTLQPRHYRQILQEFHSSTKLGEQQVERLNTARFKTVWFYPSVRAQYKVQALMQYLEEPAPIESSLLSGGDLCIGRLSMPGLSAFYNSPCASVMQFLVCCFQTENLLEKSQSNPFNSLEWLGEGAQLTRDDLELLIAAAGNLEGSDGALKVRVDISRDGGEKGVRLGGARTIEFSREFIGGRTMTIIAGSSDGSRADLRLDKTPAEIITKLKSIKKQLAKCFK